MSRRFDGVDVRSVLVFLAFSFGVAWAVGGDIWLTGGFAGGPLPVSGVPAPRAVIPLATGYVWVAIRGESV